MSNTTQLRLESEQAGRSTSHGLNNLHSALTTLIDRLDESIAAKADVIEWGCPVLSFGDLSNSRVASMGLNPSNREFVDESGKELQGEARRFHTLNSLGLSSWADVDARHLELILESCSEYFLGNPYDTWFKKLDRVIQGAEASFYDTRNGACHLDLIPYATARKWTDLTSAQRASLLAVAADTLGLLLRDSPIRILILNGQTVVDQFQEIAGVCLEKQTMPEWTLSRNLGKHVVGFGYIGTVSSVSGINLQHDVLVLGYNHNLQSSFGVTSEAINAIRDWISRAAREAIP